MANYRSKGEDNPAYRHGHNLFGERSAEYTCWAGIKARTGNPNEPLFPYYGGRGITMDLTWDDFTVFLLDVGEKPTPQHSLDRIDNERGYCKDNVRWATKKEQARNRRSNLVFERNGEKHCLREWCEIFSVPYKRTWRRIKDGWSFDEAVTSRGQANG